jgi:uncharacterized protein (TIGR00255 family)
MRSMTGYGLGEATLSHDGLGSTRIAIEARSLNHRYLEIRVRTSPDLGEHASLLEQLCRERLTRGRYDVSVRSLDAPEQDLRIDPERAKRWYRELQQIASELNPNEPLAVSVLAQFPGLFQSPPRANTENARQALTAALEQALAALDAMREAEGRALQAELRSRLSSARSLQEQIAALSPKLLTQYHDRLKSRLERLLADSGAQAQVDPGRLEQELALLADRSDITEELVRLVSHFQQFGDLIQQAEPVGRRLDFLLQEIGRETNTIGSKSQDAGLSHRVVELKSEIERMREQVQNVE